MSGKTYEYQYQKHQPKSLVHAVRTMPRWKWTLLKIGLLIGCIGIAGQAMARLSPSPPPVPPGVHSSPSSGTLVGTQTPMPASSTPGASTDATTPANAPDHSITQLLTPYMTHVGFSIFVGVIVGLIFRTFLRIALLLTALIVGGAAALSYFHIVNIDLSTVSEEARQATNWLAYQGNLVKNLLFSALPSSSAAGIGFFLGFKRR